MIRWGIISTGRIANEFAEALGHLPDAEIAAVGSRTIESARAFAEKHRARAAYASYEELVADPNVDVVYIGTPHSHHYDNMKLALNAGKPVLCEKAFTVNARQAAEVIALARQKKLFLMEGMWTRFIPAIVHARQLVQEGAIGDPKLVTAEFAFAGDYDPQHRLWNPELAGGSLLDVGVYVLAMASMVFGRPQRVQTTVNMAPTGVDDRVGMLLSYTGGRMAVLACGTTTYSKLEAGLSGDKGFINIHAPFWKASKLTVGTYYKQESQTLDFPYPGNGLEFEAAEVHRCLNTGLLESPHMPLDETLAIMETMDGIRAEWGLKYPNE